MYGPPLDPRDDPLDSSRTVPASYAAMALTLLLLWGVSQPLASGVALATAVGLAAGGHPVLRLVRCLRARGGFSLAPGGRVRVSVTPVG